jgi:hypothetical protein
MRSSPFEPRNVEYCSDPVEHGVADLRDGVRASAHVERFGSRESRGRPRPGVQGVGPARNAVTAVLSPVRCEAPARGDDPAAGPVRQLAQHVPGPHSNHSATAGRTGCPAVGCAQTSGGAGVGRHGDRRCPRVTSMSGHLLDAPAEFQPARRNRHPLRFETDRRARRPATAEGSGAVRTSWSAVLRAPASGVPYVELRTCRWNVCTAIIDDSAAASPTPAAEPFGRCVHLES